MKENLFNYIFSGIAIKKFINSILESLISLYWYNIYII